MRIQTFIRHLGFRFVVFQVAFYKVSFNDPTAHTEYLLTTMSGELPGRTVAEFFESGIWFHDLMSFAKREKQLKDGNSMRKEEATQLLGHWRKNQERRGFTVELEFMDGILQVKKTREVKK